MRASWMIKAAWMCVTCLAWVCAATHAAEEGSDWYPFTPKEDVGPSVIGMQDWLDAPAGKHGGVRVVGDRFEFTDGTPVKFWGVNLGNTHCAPKPEDGAAWAAFHAKYGVNCVRLHKFVGPGWAGIGDPNDSTRFTAEGLDRLDRFCAELKKRGIYYGWSWIFEHSVRPDDKQRLVAYDELVAAGGSTTRVPVFIAEDIQDLRIAMLTALLAHRNPYTGLTYAEDPGLAFVELHNEDCIFFYTFGGFNKLDSTPTYKKLFLQRFSAWLRTKYGSHEGLVKAWGEKAMNAYEIKGEHLDKNNIMVQGNPWFASPDGLAQAKGQGTVRRLLDTAAFLYEAQGGFYRRFAKAIRDAGYQGPLVGSCWATPAGLPQYYNLHNDFEVGFIDRHTYFGGMGGFAPKPGKFNAAAQVDNPGAGLLSTGLLQVGNRPFAVSEWTSVFPNEWLAESPAIYAVYGMGLQGWDASYEFASHVYGNRLFANRVCDPRMWVVDLPNQIGLYPALARMIYRGDVREGPVISTRRVSIGELREGKPEWVGREQIKQSWDFKEYGGAVSAAALAAGRVTVEFVDAPAASVFPDMSKYVREDAVRSAAGQLVWYGAQQGRRGYFQVDTDGTKALVGFPPKSPVALGKVTFSCETPFACLFLTARDRDATLATARSALLVAMARVRNTGMKFNAEGNELLELGRPPLLIEPVRAKVTIAGRKIKSVHVLDHDGRRTEVALPVADGAFSIDGARDRSFYYDVELD